MPSFNYCILLCYVRLLSLRGLLFSEGNREAVGMGEGRSMEGGEAAGVGDVLYERRIKKKRGREGKGKCGEEGWRRDN